MCLIKFNNVCKAIKAGAELEETGRCFLLKFLC